MSSDATLKPLGTFKITLLSHVVSAVAPGRMGVTSTGVTATTNRTIAVDPTQIPYGSKVVINGQVYVAEDCGGAIKHNCIDIYVATHQEGKIKAYIIQTFICLSKNSEEYFLDKIVKIRQKTRKMIKSFQKFCRIF